MSLNHLSSLSVPALYLNPSVNNLKAQGNLDVSGNIAVTGSQTFTGSQVLSGNLTVSGRVLGIGQGSGNGAKEAIYFGTASHAYREYYNNANPPVRLGYLGYDSPATENFSIVNQRANGTIELHTNNILRWYINPNGSIVHNTLLTGANNQLALTSSDGGAGTSQFLFNANGAGSYRTSWAMISDERIKYNIEDINDFNEKIDNLRPRHYNLVDDGKEKYGFIGQEVVNVLPNSVQIFQNRIPLISKTAKLHDNKIIFEHNEELKLLNDLEVEEENNIKKYKILEKVNDKEYLIDREEKEQEDEYKDIKVLGLFVDNFHAVAHDEMIPLLVACVKDLRKKNIDLEERLKKLEAKFSL